MEEQPPEIFEEQELSLEAIQGAETLGLDRDDLEDEKIKEKLLVMYNYFKKKGPPNFSMFMRGLDSELGFLPGVEPFDKLYMHIWRKIQEEKKDANI